MKTVLAQINEVITSLEKKGHTAEAQKLDRVFTKIAQDTLLDKAKGVVDTIGKGVKKILNPSPQPVAVGSPFVYVVKSGDIFDSLVNAHREKLAAQGSYVGMKQSFQDLIKSMNPGINTGLLQPGQRINLPRATKNPNE